MSLDPAVAIGIAIWIWIAIGLSSVVGAVLFVRSTIDATDWIPPARILALFLGGSGLLTLGVAATGWTPGSLYIWRASAIICLFLGPAILFLKYKRGQQGLSGSSQPQPSTPAHRSAIVGTAVMAGYVWLSFQGNAPVISARAMNAEVNGLVQKSTSVSFFFWIGALALLALGTLIFLALFVQRLQRGGAPKIETHWGGIGGGLGGWRMSTSLGYLLVAIVLSLLFAIFLDRFDAHEQRQHDKESASQSVAAPPGPPNTSVTPAKSPPAVAPSNADAVTQESNTAKNEQSSQPPER